MGLAISIIAFGTAIKVFGDLASTPKLGMSLTLFGCAIMLTQITYTTVITFMKKK